MKKTGTLRRVSRRALSLLLAALSLVQFVPPMTRAADNERKDTIKKLVLWTKVTDVQSQSWQLDYTDENSKYDRVMFYKTEDGDSYFFNGAPESVTKGKSDYVYLDDTCRVGNSAYKEWNEDFADNTQFITGDGLRTPYARWAGRRDYSDKSNVDVNMNRLIYEKPGNKYTYETWKLFLADKTDAVTDYGMFIESDTDDEPFYAKQAGFDDNSLREWVIGNKTMCLLGDHYIIDSGDQSALWTFDLDGSEDNDVLNFRVEDKRLYSKSIKSKASMDFYDVALGKEYDMPALSADFTVDKDQITTLGRPFYYIPKGLKITVLSGGVLSVDGMLLNDGTIEVQDGGLLILKDGAKVMPLTKLDDNCGTIISNGSIVVEEDALLCGGAANGVNIQGGGVINFGTISAESMTVSQSYAVENRESGYIIAGHSPTRAARIRYIFAAANDEESPAVDTTNDFAKLSKTTDSHSWFAPNAVYGNTKNWEQREGKAIGSATQPVMSLYKRATPTDTWVPVFEQMPLEEVVTRVEGDKVTFTVGDASYEVENQLVSANVGRGNSGNEKLFENKWAGSLDGALVRISSASNPNSTLKLNSVSKSRSTQNGYGTPRITSGGGGNLSEWWRVKQSSATYDGEGELNGQPLYYLENLSYPKFVLGLRTADVLNDPWYKVIYGTTPIGSVPVDGTQVHCDSDSGGSNQRWLLVKSDNGYTFRSAMNPGLCLSDDSAGGLRVSTMADVPDQKWKLNSLFNEAAFGAAVNVGAGVELSPMSNKGSCLDGESTASGGSVALVKRDGEKASQRWNFEKMGTDNLNGVITSFYRIVNAQTGAALTVKDGSYLRGVAVGPEPVIAGTDGSRDSNSQYWYITSQKESGYVIASRGDAGCVLGDDGSGGVSIQSMGTVDQKRWQFTGSVKLVDTQEAEQAAETPEDPFGGKVFSIACAGDESLRIGLIDNKTDDFTRLSVQRAAAGTLQSWAFEKVGVVYLGGKPKTCYLIRSVYANKYLDSSGMADDGTAPYVHEGQDSVNRQWFVESAGDGYYYIVPRYSATKSIGVAGTTVARNKTVVNGTTDGSVNGKWKLVEAFEPQEYGTFTLIPKHTSLRVASMREDGMNVLLTNYKNNHYDRWTFTQVGEDDGKPFYRIDSKANGQAMTVYGTNVAPSTFLGLDTQLWYLEEAEKDADGKAAYYYITYRGDTKTKDDTKKTKAVLDVAGASTDSGANIQISDYSGANSQKWSLNDIFEPVDLGVYEIGPADAVDKRMDVVGASSDNRANIQITHRQGGNSRPHEEWKIVQRGVDMVNGKSTPFYSIESVGSGKALDLSGYAKDAMKNRASVWQFDYDGYSDQHWYMEVRKDKSVVFRNRADSNLVLEIAGTGDGSNVLIGTYKGEKATNQRWQLHPIMKNDNGRYYIPGNEAAAAAGVPYVGYEDTPVSPISGKFYVSPDSNPNLLLNLKVKTGDKATLVTRPAKEADVEASKNYITTVTPMGVDYFDGYSDGEGRVFYKINCNVTEQETRYRYVSAGMMGAIPVPYTVDVVYDSLISLEGYNKPAAGKLIMLEENTGDYDQLWYIEPVRGREDVYQLIARGTFSDDNSVCMEVKDQKPTTASQVSTGVLRGGAGQLWRFDTELKLQGAVK